MVDYIYYTYLYKPQQWLAERKDQLDDQARRRYGG